VSWSGVEQPSFEHGICGGKRCLKIGAGCQEAGEVLDFFCARWTTSGVCMKSESGPGVDSAQPWDDSVTSADTVS
jgi:hypothetical protein